VSSFQSSTVNAIVIKHNNSTLLFGDDFETGTIGGAWDNGAQPGNWTLPAMQPNPFVNQVSNTAPPGAFQGTKYGLVQRVASQQGIRAQFQPVSSGKLELDTMFYVPDGEQWLTVVLGNNLNFNPLPSFANPVHSYIIFHLNATHLVSDYNTGADEFMPFEYKNGEWMRLKIGYDYANATTGYTVDLTTSAETGHYERALTNSDQPINSMLIKFEDNNKIAYFDAVTALPPPSLLGDFNNDTKVDAADYVVWRKNNGGNTTPLPNDNGLGLPINDNHYQLWRANFGSGSSGSSAAFGSTVHVPEPGTLTLAALGSLLIGAARRAAKEVLVKL
jgi:hypothetical protein